MRRSVALLAVLLLAACGGGGPSEPTTAAPSPPDVEGCPERYPAAADEPWVPAPPTTETPGRLVPDADPVEALVCRYDGAGPATLDGAVALEAGLDRIRTDLLVPARVDGARRACAPGGRLPYLARLRYADGELWLSAVDEPRRCMPSGNGVFVSSASLGALLAQAYDSASWPSLDPDVCAREVLGRAGQERALVPEGWSAVTVCGGGLPREVAPDLAGQVVALLGQVGTGPVTGACDGAAGTVPLVASYPEGPPVVVRFSPGCQPAVSNGSLTAVLTPAQTELLGVLLG